MKNYTSQLLIATILTAVLGFTGLEYPGAAFVRFIFLLSSIGLMISCLDSLILSRKMKRISLKEKHKDVHE